MKKDTILILGGDGYLGWSLGLAFAKRTDSNIILLDNMIKRHWEKEVDAQSLIPYKSPEDRITEYERIFGKSNLSFEKIDLMEYDKVVKSIKKHRPTIIINAAQQPSAPFSMMSAKNAAATFSNNIIGHLNVLWAISETDKNIKYIKLGSAGCYSGIDTDYVPLEKVELKFNHKEKNHEISKSWVPMYATDLYHQSKINDFLLNDLACDVWKLKVITVQQATIFGATIEENHSKENSGLSTRFNYDSVFGTVMNRFVCELHLGGPLTVYGDGNQTTGLISLSDTVNNFINFAEMDIMPGEHKVVHNYTMRLSVNEIAKAITDIDGSISVSHIQNPRKEIDGNLKKEFEAHNSIQGSHENIDKKLKIELIKLIEFVGRYKNNIDASVIMPKILWEKVQKKEPLQKTLKKEKSSLTMQPLG